MSDPRAVLDILEQIKRAIDATRSADVVVAYPALVEIDGTPYEFAKVLAKLQADPPPLRPDNDPLLSPFCTLSRACQDHLMREYDSQQAEWSARQARRLS